MPITPTLPVSSPVPQVLPLAQNNSNPPVELDQFDASNAVPQGPQPQRAEIVKVSESAVRSFMLELEQKKRAHETANAIVSCLTPMLTPAGFMEDQVWLFLLRIMGKVQSEQRDNDIEATKLDRLQRAIVTEQEKMQADQKDQLNGAISVLGNIEEELRNTIKTHSAEENQAIETLSSLMRTQHEAAMATLREMRAF